MKQIEKFSKTFLDKETLLDYLTFSQCMLFISNYAEQQDRDVIKMRNNILTLVEIATSFSHLDSFF